MLEVIKTASQRTRKHQQALLRKMKFGPGFVVLPLAFLEANGRQLHTHAPTDIEQNDLQRIKVFYTDTRLLELSVAFC